MGTTAVRVYAALHGVQHAIHHDKLPHLPEGPFSLNWEFEFLVVCLRPTFRENGPENLFSFPSKDIQVDGSVLVVPCGMFANGCYFLA